MVGVLQGIDAARNRSLQTVHRRDGRCDEHLARLFLLIGHAQLQQFIVDGFGFQDGFPDRVQVLALG